MKGVVNDFNELRSEHSRYILSSTVRYTNSDVLLLTEALVRRRCSPFNT